MDPSPPQQGLEYAPVKPVDPSALHTSGYAIAALAVSSASLAWFFLPFYFTDGGKIDRIGELSGILGMLLSVAARPYQPKKRWILRLSFYCGLLSFLLHFLCPTL